MINFLIFGLMLNVIAFLIHLILTSISVSRLGLMKSFELSQIALKVFNEYKELMLKHHKILWYLEQVSLFIPFYALWIFVKIWINPRDCSYFELPLVLKNEAITDLVNEYGRD